MTLGVGVGLVSGRRVQDDEDRRPCYGRGPARPCGSDPEELDDTHHDEHAHGIDQSGKQIGHAEPHHAILRSALVRIGQQHQSVERARYAAQCLRGPVGQQPQRWCFGWQRDESPYRRRADPAQAARVGCPAWRAAFHWPRLQLPRETSQNGVGLLPLLVVRQKLEMIGDHAPP